MRSWQIHWHWGWTKSAWRRFLSNDPGLFPKLITVTDSPDETLRSELEGRIKELSYNPSPAVIFEEDSYRIWEEIARQKIRHPTARTLKLHLQIPRPGFSPAMQNNKMSMVIFAID